MIQVVDLSVSPLPAYLIGLYLVFIANNFRLHFKPLIYFQLSQTTATIL